MDGRCIRTLVDDKNMGMVSGLTVVRDTVVVFTMDSSARLWKMDGRVGKILKGHENTMYWMGVCLIQVRNVSGGGSMCTVLCGSEDGRIVGWDLESGIRRLIRNVGIVLCLVWIVWKRAIMGI